MIKTKRRNLGDIPEELLKIRAHPETGKTPPDAKRRPPVDLRYHTHMSMMLSKLQMHDDTTVPFDDMTMSNEVAAGTTETILSFKMNQGIEGILETYGWFTDADGDAFLYFGLYIAGQIVAPLGKYSATGATPLRTETWSPSGESIAASELCPAYIYVPTTKLIEIRVTNESATDAFPAWARIRGRNWPIESVDSKMRSFYNTKEGRIV